MTTQQKALILAVLVAVLLLIYLLRPILTPFLVGLLIAYLGDPLVDRLERAGLARTLAVVIVFVLLSTLLIALLVVVVPMVIRETTALVHRIPDFVRWLQQALQPWLLSHFAIDIQQIDTEEMKRTLLANWREAGGLVGRMVGEMTRSGYALVAWITNLGLIPVVAFYLMRDWDRLLERLRELAPASIENTMITLARECDEVVSAFLRGQLLIMCILGCLYALGLTLVGLELALLIGLLAGLASIVPYLGFVVGIAAASVAAIFQFQDALHVLYVALVFGAGQALEGWVLTPLLVGDRIGLHPVAVIFAILAGGQLFGFAGILLALPAAAVIMVFLRHLHERYRGSHLFAPGEEES